MPGVFVPVLWGVSGHFLSVARFVPEFRRFPGHFLVVVRICPGFVALAVTFSFCGEVCPRISVFSGTFLPAWAFSPGLAVKMRMFCCPTRKPSYPQIVIKQTNTSYHEKVNTPHHHCNLLDRIFQLPHIFGAICSSNTQFDTPYDVNGNVSIK